MDTNADTTPATPTTMASSVNNTIILNPSSHSHQHQRKLPLKSSKSIIKPVTPSPKTKAAKVIKKKEHTKHTSKSSKEGLAIRARKKTAKTQTTESKNNKIDIASNNNATQSDNRYADKQIDKWNKRYQEAKEFRLKEGHAIIPNDYPPNPALGSWAKRQRYQYQVYQKNLATTGQTRLSSMSPERIEMLESIGFCWHHKDFKWWTRYADLQQFVKEHGHAAVPTQYRPNQNLAGWVKVQRRQYKLFQASDKKSSMTQERVDKLNELGFVWAIKESIPFKKVNEKTVVVKTTRDNSDSENEPLPRRVSEEEEEDDDDSMEDDDDNENRNEMDVNMKEEAMNQDIVEKREKAIDEKQAVLALLSFGM